MAFVAVRDYTKTIISHSNVDSRLLLTEDTAGWAQTADDTLDAGKHHVVRRVTKRTHVLARNAMKQILWFPVTCVLVGVWI